MCVEQRATWGQWTRQKPLLTRVRPQSIFGYVSLLSSQQGLRMVLPLLLAFPPLQRNKSSTAADDKLLKVEHGGLVKGSFHKTGKREQNRWWLGEERRCKEEVWGAETAQCQVSRRQAFHGRMAETWPSMFKGRWATNIPTEVWRLAKYQTIQYHNVVLIWHWLDSLGVEKRDQKFCFIWPSYRLSILWMLSEENYLGLLRPRTFNLMLRFLCVWLLLAEKKEGIMIYFLLYNQNYLNYT